MPKVSVIIPVYGVEKYIERCARSLFEQTLDDIEYLFVDDCTPDHSIDILKQVLEDYPHRKAQVSILQLQKNSGLCRVREWGLKHAKGDYIAHCDSDDWVVSDMYETLYETAQAEQADIVICDYYKSKGDKHRNKKGCYKTEKVLLLEDLLYKRCSWAVWNKLFKRSLYTPDFVFPTGSMGEDMVMVIQAIINAQKIGYIPRALYHYAVNPSSMVRTKTIASSHSQYLQQKSNTEIVLHSLAEDHTLTFLPQSQAFLQYLYSINFTPLAYHNRECLQQWRETCPRMGLGFFLNKKIAFRHKFKYIKLSILCIFKGYNIKSHV